MKWGVVLGESNNEMWESQCETSPENRMQWKWEHDDEPLGLEVQWGTLFSEESMVSMGNFLPLRPWDFSIQNWNSPCLNHSDNINGLF